MKFKVYDYSYNLAFCALSSFKRVSNSIWPRFFLLGLDTSCMGDDSFFENDSLAGITLILRLRDGGYSSAVPA